MYVYRRVDVCATSRVHTVEVRSSIACAVVSYEVLVGAIDSKRREGS